MHNFYFYFLQKSNVNVECCIKFVENAETKLLKLKQAEQKLNWAEQTLKQLEYELKHAKIQAEMSWTG